MTRSRGFTLIELLVVVAILGIISAVGIVAYNGYLSGAKQKTAINIMQQISLAQAEHKSDYDGYESTGCSAANHDTSLDIEKKLFGVDAGASERTIITDDVGYYFCIKDDDPYYEIQAQERDSASPCIIKLNGQTLGITKGSEC